MIGTSFLASTATSVPPFPSFTISGFQQQHRTQPRPSRMSGIDSAWERIERGEWRHGCSRAGKKTGTDHAVAHIRQIHETTSLCSTGKPRFRTVTDDLTCTRVLCQHRTVKTKTLRAEAA